MPQRKRHPISLNGRGTDGRGADAFFPPVPQDAKTVSGQDVETANSQDRKTVRPQEGEKLKQVTVYLRVDQVVRLDLDRVERLRGGVTTDRSALVREALDTVYSAQEAGRDDS